MHNDLPFWNYDVTFSGRLYLARPLTSSADQAELPIIPAWCRWSPNDRSSLIHRWGSCGRQPMMSFGAPDALTSPSGSRKVTCWCLPPLEPTFDWGAARITISRTNDTHCHHMVNTLLQCSSGIRFIITRLFLLVLSLPPWAYAPGRNQSFCLDSILEHLYSTSPLGCLWITPTPTWGPRYLPSRNKQQQCNRWVITLFFLHD